MIDVSALRTDHAQTFLVAGGIHDRPDRPDAAAAFDPAPQTAVDLMRSARQFSRGAHDHADVMVGQDIAGADDHDGRVASDMPWEWRRDCRKYDNRAGVRGFHQAPLDSWN
jgi:hypothetical protein